jgi:hypothetical protein
MSVKSNQISGIFYELDIIKVACSLGIDQDRLLAYVYSNTETNKRSDERMSHPIIGFNDLT